MTSDATKTIEAGEHFFISSGAYSEYQIWAHGVAKKQITVELLRQLEDSATSSAVMTKLVSGGYAEEIEVHEVWSDYDTPIEIQ